MSRAPEPTTPETPDTLTLPKIAERMAASDSRATAHPIYIVQQRVRDYGYDPQFDGEVAWVQADEGCEVDDEEAERLEREYRATGKQPVEFVRTCYVDRWEFVTACVSERGCEEYIRANGHNLTDPRIYVASGHRNREWQTLRREIAPLVSDDWGQVAAVVGSGMANRLKEAGFTFVQSDPSP